MDQFDIPIFKNLYELYKEFYQYLHNFPKRDKYSIGQKCDTTLLEMLRLLIRATGLPKFKKLPYLENMSLELNVFRIYIRLAKDIKALNNKHYIALQIQVDEIGCMLGGWIKSINQYKTLRERALLKR